MNVKWSCDLRCDVNVLTIDLHTYISIHKMYMESDCFADNKGKALQRQ